MTNRTSTPTIDGLSVAYAFFAAARRLDPNSVATVARFNCFQRHEAQRIAGLAAAGYLH